MNRTQKEAFVEHLRGELETAQSVILTSYQQLEVNTINELRGEFRKNNVEFHIVKNTLAKLAIAGTEMEALSSLFSGPIAIAYSNDDAVAPAKLVNEFAKKNKEKFEIKGGFIEGEVLDVAGVSSLAELPSKDELRVMILRMFSAGPIELLRTLSAGPQEFAMLIEAKRQKDEKAA